MSATLEPKKRRARTGWTRLGTQGKCGAVYVHDASGWVVRHCGHPTAIWPYYAEHPKLLERGAMLTSGGVGLGKGFHRLVPARVVIEYLAAGGHLHTAACVRDGQLTCGHASYWQLTEHGK